MLVDGKWTEAWRPVQATDAKGGFVRQASSFRNWVMPLPFSRLREKAARSAG